MRVSLFVDGPSFFYMQKDRLHWWVDPKRLLEWSRTRGELIDAFYYVAVDGRAEPQQESFHKALTYMGYALVPKELRSGLGENGTERRRANLDVEIVLDMFNTIEHFDMAILVSGAVEFERPLQTLRARGKRFMVVSTQGFIGRDVRATAGLNFLDMNEIRSEVEKIAVHTGSPN